MLPIPLLADLQLELIPVQVMMELIYTLKSLVIQTELLILIYLQFVLNSFKHIHYLVLLVLTLFLFVQKIMHMHLHLKQFWQVSLLHLLGEQLQIIKIYSIFHLQDLGEMHNKFKHHKILQLLNLNVMQLILHLHLCKVKIIKKLPSLFHQNMNLQLLLMEKFTLQLRGMTMLVEAKQLHLLDL